MTIGTSYFTSLNAAIWYYHQYDPGERRTEIARQVGQKIAEGSIHIGRPPLEDEGDRIITIDHSSRYAIVKAAEVTATPEATDAALIYAAAHDEVA